MDGGDLRLELVRERLVLRRALDVRAPWDFDLLGLAFVGRGEDVDVIDIWPELRHRQ